MLLLLVVYKLEENHVGNNTIKNHYTGYEYVKNVSPISSHCVHTQSMAVCLLVQGNLTSYNQDKNSHPSDMWPTQGSPVISNHGAGGEGEETKDQKRKWGTGRTSVCQ